MIVTIQNECLTVDIEDLGAQLASVRNHHGTKYLWQGDADIWARRAPILFPILGRLRENTYLLDGVPHKIGQHGFARDCIFELVEHSSGLPPHRQRGDPPALPLLLLPHHHLHPGGQPSHQEPPGEEPLGAGNVLRTGRPRRLPGPSGGK